MRRFAWRSRRSNFPVLFLARSLAASRCSTKLSRFATPPETVSGTARSRGRSAAGLDPDSRTSNSMGPIDSRSPRLSDASVKDAPFSRVSLAQRLTTVLAALRIRTQWRGCTPWARTRSVQCSPDPIEHLALLRRTTCPSRCEPQIRRTRGPKEDVPSEFALRRVVVTASTMSFPFSATFLGNWFRPHPNWYFRERLDQKPVNLLVDLAYARRRVKGHEEVLPPSCREYGKRAAYPCRFCRLSDSNN
jgi:hypothetical protein